MTLGLNTDTRAPIPPQVLREWYINARIEIPPSLRVPSQIGLHLATADRQRIALDNDKLSVYHSTDITTAGTIKGIS